MLCSRERGISPVHLSKLDNAVGKISIEHVTYFSSKYISKDAVDMEFSPDVDNNQFNPHMQINQTIDVHKLCVIMRDGKKY